MYIGLPRCKIQRKDGSIQPAKRAAVILLSTKHRGLSTWTWKPAANIIDFVGMEWWEALVLSIACD